MMVHLQSVIKLIGGEDMIGQEIKSELDFAEAVRKGFNPGVIELLFDGSILTKSDMERLVMPRRTLNHRINKGERLTREESDRVARVARILAMAEETFGNREKASQWLRKPKRSFANQTPLDMLDTEEGARLVEDRMFKIAHGLAA
jgi:putative toxin-antitoxin system antitoxin component (TIGR02293 family)